ncbi:MAG: Rpp14/Pop5 family protein [Thermoprotei archaeon]
MNDIMVIIVYASLTLSIIALAALFFVYKKFTRTLHKISILLRRGGEEEKARKIRKRYIVFSVISEHKFSKSEVEDALRKTFREYFGELGLVTADPQLIYFDPSLQRGIIRVAHTYKEHVLSILNFVKRIGSYPCIIVPIKTTGTIKRARKIMYSLERNLQK